MRKRDSLRPRQADGRAGRPKRHPRLDRPFRLRLPRHRLRARQEDRLRRLRDHLDGDSVQRLPHLPHRHRPHQRYRPPVQAPRRPQPLRHPHPDHGCQRFLRLHRRRPRPQHPRRQRLAQLRARRAPPRQRPARQARLRRRHPERRPALGAAGQNGPTTLLRLVGTGPHPARALIAGFRAAPEARFEVDVPPGRTVTPTPGDLPPPPTGRR